MKAEQISLYCKKGSADKVYHAQLVEKGDAFVVNVQYGRRGSTLQSLTKTASPLPYERAKKIYDALLTEKFGKGYTVGEDGTPYQGTDKASRVSGLEPQLLNPITESEAEGILLNGTHGAQEKFNGERRMLQRKNGGADVVGVNRKGLTVGLPQPLADAAAAASPYSTFVLDGEAVGDVLYVFDALEMNGEFLSGLPYAYRHKKAAEVVIALNSEYIRIVPLAVTPAEKRALFKDIKARNGEGLVFKDMKAPYTADRPASGGPQLKYKFVESASCIVEATNEGKRSVALMLLDKSGKPVPVGNVTIPPNFAIPEAGSTVEVRYLYANKGGSLYQPVFLGPRADIDPAACKLTQLKFAA